MHPQLILWLALATMSALLLAGSVWLIINGTKTRNDGACIVGFFGTIGFALSTVGCVATVCDLITKLYPLP